MPWEVDEAEQSEAVYRFRIANVNMRFRPTRATLRGTIELPDGASIGCGATLFGAKNELDRLISGAEVLHMLASVVYLDALPWLRVKRVVPAGEVGTIKPRYPRGHRVTAQPGDHGAYHQAADWLLEQFARDPSRRPGGAEHQALHELLYRKLMAVHEPDSLAKGVSELTRLKNSICRRLIEQAAQEHRAVIEMPPEAVLAEEFVRTPRLPRLKGVELNAEQMRAVREILADLGQRRRMWRLLMGDVGCGKTLVYLTAAATMAAAGYPVVILEPTRPLANQVEAVLEAAFVASGVIAPEERARIRVDTTGVLFDQGAEAPALTIIDEQQKYSVGQKMQAAQPGAHVLEVSATFIPRSQALAELGVYPISRLVNPPIERDIRTRAIRYGESRRLLDWVDRYLEANPGRTVLVVYPQRDAKDAAAVKDAEGAAGRWAKRHPTEVVHGTTEEGEVSAALARIIRGESRVLVTTVLLETGLDLPNLGAVIIAHAERFGLATLHQIRGRVARRGGRGYCHLIAGPDVKDEAWDRIAGFAKTRLGDEVAAMDLDNRGAGDLGAFSTVQHGDPKLLPGLELAEWMSRNRDVVRRIFSS